MHRSKIDLGVGIFVAIGIGALFFLAFKVGNLGSDRIEQPYTVTAGFGNVGGLKTRAPVKASGVVVGRVVEIHYDTGEYRALVTLSLDGRYRFPRDTFATINTSGLLGEQYVGLEPGGDEKPLAPGDMITRTQSAVVLEKLIGRFMIDKASDGGSQ